MRFSFEHHMCVRRFGDGPELVWIHGLGESSTSFEPIARHPAFANYTHVLPDLPGYGRTPWSESPMDLEALARRLSAWLAERPPAVIIGHSMGGVLVSMIAERIAVRGVVDIDGNISRGDCNFSGQVVPYTAEEFAKVGFQKLRDDTYERGMTQRPLRGYHAAMCFASPAMFYRHSLDLVEISEREDRAARLAGLRPPVLYIAGGLPDGICERSRELLSKHGIRWITIENTGHWVYLDAPDAFAQAVAGFLAELPRP
jgi:pimeloyl-ACP methyl ester carboxylesterase